MVFALNASSSVNGGFVGDYDYPTWSLANADDEIILSYGGLVIDQVYYDGGPNFPDPNGASASLDPAFTDSVSNDVGANWCNATTTFGLGDEGTPGAVNDTCP